MLNSASGRVVVGLSPGQLPKDRDTGELDWTQVTDDVAQSSAPLTLQFNKRPVIVWLGLLVATGTWAVAVAVKVVVVELAADTGRAICQLASPDAAKLLLQPTASVLWNGAKLQAVSVSAETCWCPWSPPTTAVVALPVDVMAVRSMARAIAEAYLMGGLLVWGESTRFAAIMKADPLMSVIFRQSFRDQ
jgi:hypothetical protein